MAKKLRLGDALKILSCFSVFLSGFPVLTTSNTCLLYGLGLLVVMDDITQVLLMVPITASELQGSLEVILVGRTQPVNPENQTWV